MEPWKKTLFVTLIIIFFQSIGISMLMPFIPLFIKELGVVNEKAQATWSGIIFGVSYFSLALTAPFWGSISDKHGRKPLILRTTFGVSLIALLMSLVTNVYQLLILRILHGVCGGLMPVLIALVSRHLPKEKTGQGLGTMQAALLAGGIVGPFIGGILSDWVGFRNVLLIIAASTFTAGLITLFFIREAKEASDQTPAKVLANIKFVTSSSDLRTVVLSLFAVQFSLFLVEPIFPLFIVSLHPAGSSGTIVGLVFSIAGFFTMFFVPYWGKKGDKKSHHYVLLQSMLLSGIFYFPQALVSSAYQLLPLRAVIGLCIAGIMPSTQAIIVKNTTDSQRGGVLGVTHSVNILGQALGPLVGGALGALLGYRIPFVLTSVFLIVLWCYFRNSFQKAALY